MIVIVVAIIAEESSNLFIRLAMSSLQTGIHSFSKIKWILIAAA